MTTENTIELGAKLIERHAERKGDFGGIGHEAVAALLDVLQGADGNAGEFGKTGDGYVF